MPKLYTIKMPLNVHGNVNLSKFRIDDHSTRSKDLGRAIYVFMVTYADKALCSSVFCVVAIINTPEFETKGLDEYRPVASDYR